MLSSAVLQSPSLLGALTIRVVFGHLSISIRRLCATDAFERKFVVLRCIERISDAGHFGPRSRVQVGVSDSVRCPATNARMIFEIYHMSFDLHRWSPARMSPGTGKASDLLNSLTRTTVHARVPWRFTSRSSKIAERWRDELMSGKDGLAKLVVNPIMA